MELGLVGLGKMGYNLALNLRDQSYTVTAYDVNHDAVKQWEAAGGEAAGDLHEMVGKLKAPRHIWVMVPAGEATEEVLDFFGTHLDVGDTVIDGGNSHYKDSLRRAEKLGEKGIRFVDVGTSGGIEGARHGACVMAGGPREAVDPLENMFRDISLPKGYLHTGPSGSGHFLKMIHNGIEYGMMQSIAEGFDLLEKSPFEYDYENVSEVWNHGSVIRSWLMELSQQAFSKDEKLDGIKGVMNSSGEGKWTVETALDMQTAAPVITMSLMMRYRSQESDTFSGKVVAALRNEFGGHDVMRKE
ncbi:phosphogluconate dehydrogenase (NAD(+)-dependent, decarboxylating) [Salisediminibacterium halotolerans]|uniref:6-phosphogluconate dehydrogenase n=1 Tax=Salisediminibacterium halotolerans TaxID=517425 RepID=A0A1H9WDS2_9BACI|nr:decarboxylating 6-phosphogluconate dehydrogenase [Salisediminibacterium haloalkalitolerans]SES31941.1 6-phosphogluconate dehydrogenase [Salisediminibacterium haloalkalitolerans]